MSEPPAASSDVTRHDAARPDVAAVVLAAGKGTRFRSETAKVLHRAAGRSLVGHVLEALRPVGVGRTVVVVGHQRDEVRAELDRIALPGTTTAVQEDQLGTGHAVQVALPALGDDATQVLILAGDTPLLTAATLTALLDARHGHAAAVLTAEVADPTGYGRVLRGDGGTVARIVEHRDATAAERAVTEINAGVYLVDRELLVDALGRIDAANDQGELYLPDVVAVLTGDGRPVAAVVADEDEVAGVNDRWQLADAAAVLRARHLRHLVTEVGVTVVDPAATYVDVDVAVARDATLLPGTILDGATRIGERATIGPNSHLTGCEVAADASVHSSRAVDTVVGAGAQVGPFAHLRAGTTLGADTKAGAFVETKNATFGDGAKAAHLAYVGDATLGEQVNVGCGVVVVNYDGRDKHHTVVADGAFVGSGSLLVSPVTVGEGAYVAAGSTVTDDVPADALAIARSRQTTKPGWAAARRERT